MPSWDDPQYGMEEFDGSGASFIGYPSFADMQDGATRGGTALGPQLVMDIERSHPEEAPSAKPTIHWTWTVSGAKQRDNWKIEGTKAVNVDDKSLNSSTDLGKLFKSVKEHLPPIEGFDQLDAKSWAGLSQYKDNIEWGWLQEPKRMQTADGKWVDDPDAKPKSTLVITGFIGSAWYIVAEFDLTRLGDADLSTLHTLASSSDSFSKFQAGLIAIPGMPGSDVFKVLTDKTDGPAAYAALKAF